MKTVASISTCVLLLVVFHVSTVFAQTAPPACFEDFGGTLYNFGRINGVLHTSCFPWQSGDGTITLPGGSTVKNDAPRIQRAIYATANIPGVVRRGGKIIFNEHLYYVNAPIDMVSYLLLEGGGKQNETFATSKIVLTASNTHIFRFRGANNQISIRDMALEAGIGTTNTVGILAQGFSPGCPSNASSIGNQFSNLYIGKFTKGMYVNSDNSEPGCPDQYPGWQFDDTRLDHVYFSQNQTGLEINAQNSGFSMTNVHFDVPANGYGIYAPYAGYGSINMSIGAGAKGTGGVPLAETFIYIKDHSVWSIQNSASEGFLNSLILDSYGDSACTYCPYRTFPITLINNSFREGISIKNNTVVSTGNNYNHGDDGGVKLLSGTNLYSVGDKFCWEGFDPASVCQTADFIIPSGSNAKVFFKSNERETKIDNLKLSSTTFSVLSSTAENGSLVYCSDCQQTATCSGGGSGALAKRIAGAWKCN